MAAVDFALRWNALAGRAAAGCGGGLQRVGKPNDVLGSDREAKVDGEEELQLQLIEVGHCEAAHLRPGKGWVIPEPGNMMSARNSPFIVCVVVILEKLFGDHHGDQNQAFKAFWCRGRRWIFMAETFYVYKSKYKAVRACTAVQCYTIDIIRDF